MGQSIELKKREIQELKKKSDRLKAEVKAHEEKHGLRLDLTCFELIPTDRDVMVNKNVEGPLSIAKTEVSRLKRFVDILAERYAVN
jgi:hypothetical protein